MQDRQNQQEYRTHPLPGEPAVTQPTMPEIRPGTAPVGAEIFGVDLSQPLDPAVFEACETAFDRHSVVCFRNQTLTAVDLLSFSRQLGEIRVNAFNQYALEGMPGILKVSNLRDDKGGAIGYADAGSHWHSDMSYTADPPRRTLLYALEVPRDDAGLPLGPTLFASAAAAHDALDDATKVRLEPLRAIHRFSAKERGVTKRVKITEAQVEQNPDVRHPVVRRHPKTGRKALYLRKGECIGIDGMAEAEALSLIEELSDFMVQDRFVYRHHWAVGDLLMWDNPVLQHIAVRDYAWPQRRLMWRTTVG